MTSGCRFGRHLAVGTWTASTLHKVRRFAPPGAHASRRPHVQLAFLTASCPLQASMNLSKKSIADVESLAGKRVLIRVDFNVPQDKKTGAITNTQRIVGAMPTIEMALAKGAKSVVLSAHAALQPPARPLISCPAAAAAASTSAAHHPPRPAPPSVGQCRPLAALTACRPRRCRSRSWPTS